MLFPRDRYYQSGADFGCLSAVIGELIQHLSAVPSPITRRPTLAVLLASGLAVAATRVLTRSHFLYSWDSVNFALGLERIDIELHRPHPPGYIGLIAAGRILQAFTSDANLSLQLWNWIAGTAAACLMFRLAFLLATEQRLRHAWTAWAVLLASPLVWFSNSVADVYTTELLLSLIVAVLCLHARQGHTLSLYGAALTLGLGAAFKQSTAVFLILLPIWASARAPVRHRLGAAGLCLVGVSVWCIPLVLHEGGLKYLTLAWNQAISSTADSRVSGPDLRSLNRNARDFTYALVAAGTVNWLAILAGACFRSWRMTVKRGAPLALSWALPFMAAFFLVHFAKYEYALPLVPLVCLAAAAAYARLGSRLAVPVVIFQTACAVLFFLLVRPVPPEWSGGSKLYGQKTLSQKVFTEAGGILSVGVRTIRQHDAIIRGVLERTANLCPTPGTGALVVSHPIFTWRHAMYYLDQRVAIRVPVSDAEPLLVASHRELQPPSSGSRLVSVKAECKVFWILPPYDPLLDRVRRIAEVHEDHTDQDHGLVMYWTEANLTVDIGTNRLEVMMAK